MDKLQQVFEQYNKQYPASARLDRYEQDAQRMLDDGNEQADLLEWMLVHIKEARAALNKGDIDHFAQAFERVIQHRIKAGIPDYEAAVKREFPQKGGRGKRGRWGPLKSTLQLIVDEIGSSKLDDVLNAIEDEYALEDIFYPREGDPKPPAIIKEINREKNTAKYEVTKSGEVKTVLIGNINNHLTDIRKNM